jgi:enamine deaminase RidA (YjgF/YER057c/UK114 family)
MAGRIANRLKELGIALPKPPAPVASYVPAVRSGRLLFLSGQLSMAEGKLITGKVGHDLSIEEGGHAARAAALNLIAQAEAALGDLDRIARCVKLTGFVNCAPEFTDHPKVMNGASNLMAEVFGEAGRHARAAVGAASLPLGAAVEVEAVFETLP